MTSRERIEAALGHREPDRTPYFEYVMLWPVAEQLLGRPYIDFTGGCTGWPAIISEMGWEKAVRQYAADTLDLAMLLGNDMMYVVPNPPPSGEITGLPEFVPSDDPVDSVRQRNESRTQEPVGPNEDTLLIFTCLKEEMSRRGVDLPILAPAYVHGIWTDVDLMQAMILDPEVAHEHFRLATKQALALIERYIELGVDQVGIGGDFAGNRPLISPDSYREFIVPEVRMCSQRIHEAGMYSVNASDGYLWPVIDDFIVGCDVDGYLEIDLHAGMDLRRLKAEYGDRVTLYGNMDCGTTLSFGSEEEIRRATCECLEAGQGSGGHIFCASNAITGSVPLKNYLAMVNAYRDHCGLEPLSEC